MSQYSVSTTTGNLPPQVPTQFTASDATIAVPVANNLNVFGIDSTANNDNGITTTASGDTLNVVLTNRATAQITTSDATPTTGLTFSLGATPGVFYFQGYISAFDTTDTAGACYSFVSGARTTGVVGTEIGTEFKDELEEAAMTNADFSISVSGNTFEVVLVGIAGKTINWNLYLTYNFVS